MTTTKLPTEAQIREELAAVEEERQEVIAASTEHRLEVCRRRQSLLNDELRELDILRSSAYQDSKPNKREIEVTDALQQNLERERHLHADAGVLPSRWIRPDAVAAGEKEISDQRRKVDEMFAKLPSHVSPSQNILSEKEQLHRLERDWVAAGKKTARIGQEVYDLREVRKKLQQEKDQLQDSRRQAAVKAAGLQA